MERTVVIVDDSSFIAGLLSGFFEDRGFKVAATGNNGFQAVALYRQHRPDLITIDLTMPIKDGKAAMKEILAEEPRARILMITAQMGPQILECLKSGAAGYIQKPLRFDDPGFAREFEDAIRSALAATIG
jgi:two-component system chemotaxis response regulator CheY